MNDLHYPLEDKRSINAVLTCLKDIKVNEITPQTWQKPLNLSAKNYKDRKKELKEIAIKRFPDIKVTGWNQDALLMMDFIKPKKDE